MSHRGFCVSVLMVLALISFLPGSLLAVPAIPDTGQTKCYDADGNELIPCPSPGDDFYGQDAQYQPQHPRSYTKLGADGVELPDDALPADQAGHWLMTRDNVTGLTWEIKQDMDSVADYANPHDADNTFTWYDSNPETNGGAPGTPGNGTTTFDTEQFIQSLNDARYGGFDDWRMPPIKELASLVNLVVYNPAIDLGWFPGTQSSGYWSSTSIAFNTNGAWFFYFYLGHPDNYDKAGSRYVRAVRGGKSGLFDDSIISGRMADNGDATVTDTSTGLMWQKDTALEHTLGSSLWHVRKERKQPSTRTGVCPITVN